MIIGVDIGGTKTLIARFDNFGKIEKEHSFATPKDYDLFIETFNQQIANFRDKPATTLCCVGIPGLIDRRKGLVHSLGNLPWHEEKIRNDISAALNNAEVIIENDSKLAGLAEVRAMNPMPKRALYLTVSTGIGGALILNGKLSKDMSDMELGKTPLIFEGRMQHWEDFASGRAFVEAYGKSGDEVKDDMTWQSYAQERFGPGLAVACSYLQVDTLVLGGGLGHHGDHFSDYLKPYLDERLHSIVRRPSVIRTAKYGKNAVIHGCYEHAKDQLS